MSERLWHLMDDGFFWLTMTFDFLLVSSLLFTLIYAAALALASLLPMTGKFTPRAWGLPLLAVLTLAAVFSAPGELVVYALASCIRPLMIKTGLESLPLILAGAGLGLAGLVLKGLRLGRVLAAFCPAPEDPALDEALKVMNFRRPVTVKLAGPGVPAASWGLLKALIIIPEDFAERYDQRERLGIYLHELTHIRNRDSLKYVLLAALARLLWFNPLAVSFIERYRCHLEIVCDRKVAGLKLIGSLEYARLITRQAGESGGLLTGFSGDYQSISRRFSYIFNDRALRPVWRDRLIAGACLAAVLLLGLSATTRPAVIETRAQFEEMAANYPAGAGKVQVRFFWQGALGSYSLVSVDK